MSIVEILLIGVGLSMDAFAAAICGGLRMRKHILKRALVIALFFGGFQALMPLLGYALGSQFADAIDAFDHWIAFGLLLVIGGKMIAEAVREADQPSRDAEPPDAPLDLKELGLMAVATSIDALAVGVSFAFLEVDIRMAAPLIGCTTFLIALGGVYIGHAFGARFRAQAEILGGAILILIGLKILLNAFGVIPF